MREVQSALLDWYKIHGRSHLPWRMRRDPYYTIVSEFMLQQTQVDRVLTKFEGFVERFPDFETLATASSADVLRLWKGLGYNSRAVRLRQIAQTVLERFGGQMPSDPLILAELPGVGPYTVGAVRAFGFDCDDAAIDTNVRRVVHRVLHGIEFPAKVRPAQLDADARNLVPDGHGHDWNSAMMDLGSSICTARAPKCLICPLSRICAAAPIDAPTLASSQRMHGRKRSPQETLQFKKTTRFARGRIVDRLRELPPGKMISLLDLHREVADLRERTPAQIEQIVRTLERDGLVRSQADGFALPD